MGFGTALGYLKTQRGARKEQDANPFTTDVLCPRTTASNVQCEFSSLCLNQKMMMAKLVLLGGLIRVPAKLTLPFM